MPKFIPVELSKTEDKKCYSFMCPGCSAAHVIQTNPQFLPCWEFNGDVDSPTVKTSVRVRWKHNGVETVCHSFIENGKIRFLNDCTHGLADQTVDLPDWE